MSLFPLFDEGIANEIALAVLDVRVKMGEILLELLLCT